MTLAEYISQLVELGLLSKEEQQQLLETYQSTRYTADGLAEERWKEAIEPLKRAHTYAADIPLETREKWTTQWHPKEPTPETEVPSQTPTPPQSPNATEAPKKNHTSSPSPRPSHKTKRVQTHKSTVQSATTPIWLFSALLLFGVLIGLWFGASYYEPIMKSRYKVSNAIFGALGVSTDPLPIYYDREKMREKDRYVRRWIRWIRPEKYLYQQRRRYRKRFRRSKKYSPAQRARMWARLAEAHYRSRKYAYAIAFFEKALALAPNNAEWLNDYAWLLCRARDTLFRDYPKALPLAERAFKQKQVHHIADTLAEAAARNGQFARAIKLEQWAIQHAPKSSHSEYRGQIRRFQRMAKRYRPTSKPTSVPSR
tara:strand:- start:17329 stop:18435 length:1107 start_codon:yes stop_codon:yes gene_type:complete